MRTIEFIVRALYQAQSQRRHKSGMKNIFFQVPFDETGTKGIDLPDLLQFLTNIETDSLGALPEIRLGNISKRKQVQPLPPKAIPLLYTLCPLEINTAISSTPFQEREREKT